MKSFAAKNIKPWLSIALLFITGMLIQLQGFLGRDMSWLLHATSRLLEGGNYTTNFFEINPPMALPAITLPKETRDLQTVAIPYGLLISYFDDS